MAIEVRIPTILRSYTDGQKAVEGQGATIGELFADLDGRYDGLAGRLNRRGRAAPVHQRVPERRGRAVPRRAVGTGSRRRHHHRAARGRRRGPLTLPSAHGRHHALRLAPRQPRRHAAGRAAAALTQSPSAPLGQAGGPQPDRVGEGSHRCLHGRGRGEGGAADAGRDDPGADVRKHRHQPGHGRQAARLPADLRAAGEHLGRAARAAGGLRRHDRVVARGRAARTRRSGSRSRWLPSTRTG